MEARRQFLADAEKIWLLSADLDQAIQKAMQAIGQEPVPLTQYVQAENREIQLERKIAALEKQLKNQQPL